MLRTMDSIDMSLNKILPITAKYEKVKIKHALYIKWMVEFILFIPESYALHTNDTELTCCNCVSLGLEEECSI